MGIRDLTFRDLLRAGVVLERTIGRGNAPSLTSVLEALSSRVASNPAAAAQIPVQLAPQIAEAASQLQDAIAIEYGKEYADDLVARLKK
jgi:hypothetical protein